MPPHTHRADQRLWANPTQSKADFVMAVLKAKRLREAADRAQSEVAVDEVEQAP